jgi:ATP-binding cassette subfamily C protein CydC
VLLLDEPTEGLDGETAARLLAGVRAALPTAMLVVALHDRQAADFGASPITRVRLSGFRPAHGAGHAL